MLLKDNYTAEHIITIKQQTGADPSILERTVYAFGLLEAISCVGLPFIFKGGSSLLILLEKPRRLSTDIDIIVKPGIDINEYIKKAGNIFPFINVKEDKRSGLNHIEKRHFKFAFKSPRAEREITILLDVVFEENPYIKTSALPIRNNLLVSSGQDITVIVPDKNCILGDKLTAFAPHTTGIPFGVGKELEIIKQMFDCWTLLQEMDNYEIVRTVYDTVSRIEMGYRGLNYDPADCLKDTIESCVCIIGRGSVRAEDYKNFSAGINAIQGHVFTGRINCENAGIYASELMHLATSLLIKADSYDRIEKPEEFRKVAMKGIKKISNLKNVEPMAYAYMVKSLQMLQEIGLYKDGVL